MMKDGPLALERKAVQAFEAFLATIPRTHLTKIEREASIGPAGQRTDIIVSLNYADRPVTLVIEVKSSGQPRIVRDAAQQVKRYAHDAGPDAVPMVVAPYLSAQAREVCRDEKVGYLDFMGNAHLAFDSVYIEQRVEGRPEPERRALRSLFKPKAARILRAMLRYSDRYWRTVELADEAQVSLGMVSMVGTALRERDWADQAASGLRLKDPDRLLDAWAQDYEAPHGEEYRLYTHLHGKALTDKLHGLSRDDGRVVLASYSAAEWLAPYARHGTNYFYADEQGLGKMRTMLSLSPPPRGANIVIRVLDDVGIFLDAKPVDESLVATSPVQTYLDLMHAGERGEEAAQHLRRTLLHWREQ